MALPTKVVRVTLRSTFASLNGVRKGTTWCQLSFNIQQTKLFSDFSKSVAYSKTKGTEHWAKEKKDKQERPKKEYYEEVVPNQYSREMDMTLEKQSRKLSMVPDQPEHPKRLRLAIIGPPNSGKSTLANQLAKWKVSSVSDKIHTTRRNVVCVYTQGDLQIVVKDTPGVTRPLMQKRKILEPSLISGPEKSLTNVDLICVIVDSTDNFDCQGLNRKVKSLLQNHSHIPSFLIINKVDNVKDQDLSAVVRTLTNGMVGGIPLRHFGRKKVLVGRKMKKKEEMFDRTDLKYGKMDQKSVDMDSYTDSSDVDISDTDDYSEESCDVNVAEMGKQSFIYEGGISGDDRNPSEAVQRDTKEAKEMKRKKLTLYTGKNLSAKKYESVSGWSHFDRVFMTAVLYDKGVEPIRFYWSKTRRAYDMVHHPSSVGKEFSSCTEYLAERAQPGDWSYHSSVVTDQNLMQLACHCVWSAILEVCPKEVPYQVFPQIVHWNQDDNVETLKIAMEINTKYVRHHAVLVGRNGETHKKIVNLAKQKLMDLFRYKIRLILKVNLAKDGY